MKNFHQIPGYFDTTPVKRELKGQPMMWGKSPRVTFPGSPHADAEDIILRGPVGFHDRTLEELYRECMCVDYPAGELLPRTLQIAKNLTYMLSPMDRRETSGLLV